MIVLIAGAIVARLIGALARPAGVIGGKGAWLLAGAFGAWAPVWPALVAGAVGGYVPPKKRPALDAAAAAITMLLSTPTSGVVALLIAVPVMVLIGAAADAVAKKMRPRVKIITLCAGIAVSLGGAVAMYVLSPQTERMMTRLYPRFPTVAISANYRGERVWLETGAVAWSNKPEHAKRGAIFLHGSHRDGAKQAAACVIRRALVKAGYEVLAVDHPGFGESPHPGAGALASAWDPMPHIRAARQALEHKHVIVVGHEMGCAGALAALKEGLADKAFLLSGAPTSQKLEYWYDRFHAERGMEQRVPKELFEDIWKFYDTLSLAWALPKDHGPVVFVQFEHERTDVEKTRATLYSAIPGKKSTVDFDSTHALDAFGAQGVVIGSAPTTARLVDLLRD